MKKRKEREFFFAFREEIDRQNLIFLARKINTIVAYIVCIGGIIGEENLLNILEYSRCDIHKPEDMDMIIRGFSFYIGAKLIKVIDENMGLAEIINDPDNDIVRFGEQRDTSDVFKILKIFKTKVVDENGEE